jgi:hypothetical protein
VKSFRKPNDAKRQNYLLLCISLLTSLLLLELFLVISGWNKNYIEQVSGFYSSPYVPQETGYYHTWTAGKTHWLVKPEYGYVRPTNSLGWLMWNGKRSSQKGRKEFSAW